MANRNGNWGDAALNNNQSEWKNIPFHSGSGTRDETLADELRRVLHEDSAPKQAAYWNHSGDVELGRQGGNQHERNDTFPNGWHGTHSSGISSRNTYSRKKNSIIHCNICGVTCQNQTSYEAHLKGKKHLRNKRQDTVNVEDYRLPEEETHGAAHTSKIWAPPTPLPKNSATASSARNYWVRSRSSPQARGYHLDTMSEPICNYTHPAHGTARTEERRDNSLHLTFPEASENNLAALRSRQQYDMLPHASPYLPPYLKLQPLPNTSSCSSGKEVLSRLREEGKEGWRSGKPSSSIERGDPGVMPSMKTSTVQRGLWGRQAAGAGMSVGVHSPASPASPTSPGPPVVPSGENEEEKALSRNKIPVPGGMEFARARTCVVPGSLTPHLTHTTEPFPGNFADPPQGVRKNPFKEEVFQKTILEGNVPKLLDSKARSLFGNTGRLEHQELMMHSAAKQTGGYGQRGEQTRPYPIFSNVPAIPRPKQQSQPGPWVQPSARPAETGKAWKRFEIPRSSSASERRNSGGARRDAHVSQRRGLDDAMQGVLRLRDRDRYHERNMVRDGSENGVWSFRAGDQYRNINRSRDGWGGSARFRDGDKQREADRVRDGEINSSKAFVGKWHAGGSSSLVDDDISCSLLPLPRCEEDWAKIPKVPEAWGEPMSLAEWSEFRHDISNNGSDVEKLAFKTMTALLSPAEGVDLSVFAPFSQARNNSGKELFCTAQGVVARSRVYPDTLKHEDPKYSSVDEEHVDWSRALVSQCKIQDNLEFTLNGEQMDPPPDKKDMGDCSLRGRNGAKGHRKVPGSMNGGEGALRYPSSIAEAAFYKSIMAYLRHKAWQRGDDARKRRFFDAK